MEIETFVLYIVYQPIKYLWRGRVSENMEYFLVLFKSIIFFLQTFLKIVESNWDRLALHQLCQ